MRKMWEKGWNVPRMTFCAKSSCPFFWMSIALRIALFPVKMVVRNEKTRKAHS